jgi:hypothetical protein
MKFFFVCALMIATFFPALAQDANQPTKEQTRAKTGDEVWVIVNYVKENSKPEFEQWIKDVFYPALHKSKDSMTKEQLNATRWLEPARQNEDKSWTYVWIMDPVVPNADYDITSLLNKAYGEEKGKAHWEKYQSFWSKPLEAHILKQTAY